MATKAALRALTLAYEGHNTISYPIRLLGAEKKLGCTCLSVGTEAGEDQAAPNVAISVGRALGSVLRFFDFASRSDKLVFLDAYPCRSRAYSIYL